MTNRKATIAASIIMLLVAGLLGFIYSQSIKTFHVLQVLFAVYGFWALWGTLRSFLSSGDKVVTRSRAKQEDQYSWY